MNELYSATQNSITNEVEGIKARLRNKNQALLELYSLVRSVNGFDEHEEIKQNKGTGSPKPHQLWKNNTKLP